MENKVLQIDGMSCGHCVMTVKNILNEVEGIEVEDVQVGTAAIRHEAGQLPTKAIQEALDDAGFELAG